MKTRVYALFAALQLFNSYSNALLTPTHQTLPSNSLIAKSSGYSATQLGNDAASAVDVPRGGGKAQSGGTATIPNEVFNLIKSIVGAGVLSLPAGKYEHVELVEAVETRRDTYNS